MKHTFTFKAETETDHVFACSRCGVEIGFNKPGLGEPNAEVVDGVPIAPPNADDYVTPCTGEA